MSIVFIENTQPHQFQWLGYRMISLNRKPYPCVIQLHIPGLSLLMSDGQSWFLEKAPPSTDELSKMTLDIYRHIDEDMQLRGLSHD